MKDFEGWQGRNDYDAYITNLYTHDLTTKFIQHYEIIKWVDGDPVSAGAATNWIPEMEITLKDDDGNKLVLTRGSNNPDDDAYRERTMTLNGKIVAKGALPAVTVQMPIFRTDGNVVQRAICFHGSGIQRQVRK